MIVHNGVLLPKEPYWRPNIALLRKLLSFSVSEAEKFLVKTGTPNLTFPPGSELASLKTSNTLVHCDYIILRDAHFSGPVDFGTVVVAGGRVNFAGGGKVGNLLGRGQWRTSGGNQVLEIGNYDSEGGLLHPDHGFTVNSSLTHPAIKAVVLDEKFFGQLLQIVDELKDPKLNDTGLLRLFGKRNT
jgi:hypothetical protein